MKWFVQGLLSKEWEISIGVLNSFCKNKTYATKMMWWHRLELKASWCQQTFTGSFLYL